MARCDGRQSENPSFETRRGCCGRFDELTGAILVRPDQTGLHRVAMSSLRFIPCFDECSKQNNRWTSSLTWCVCIGSRIHDPATWGGAYGRGLETAFLRLRFVSAYGESGLREKAWHRYRM